MPVESVVVNPSGERKVQVVETVGSLGWSGAARTIQRGRVHRSIRRSAEADFITSFYGVFWADLSGANRSREYKAFDLMGSPYTRNHNNFTPPPYRYVRLTACLREPRRSRIRRRLQKP